MTTMLDLKVSINNVLKTNFKDIKVYSKDVEKGFDRPGFYTTVIPITMDYETTNYTSHSQMVVINYFNGKDSELDNIKINDKLIKAFGMTLKVGERYFLCKNIRGEIIDTVLQFRFDIDYFAKIEKEESNELMNDLDIEIKKE